jgi:predicted MPP superfamily phosphohydrolase
MTELPRQTDLFVLLAARMGAKHLQRRLELEAGDKAPVIGHGSNFFHWENCSPLRGVLRAALRLSRLDGRGRRNALNVQITENDIAVRGLPRRFDGFRILHLSDLHLDMSAALPAVLSERVAGLRYDICVLTGDFRFRTRGSCGRALAGMAQLRRRLADPVYGVLGNHDSITMVPMLEDMGIRMLLNESDALSRGGEAIYLAGVDDPHYFQTHNLDAACRGIPGDAVSVLLAHTPEVYQGAADAGFDVLFCGHTHGGQIRLPGNIPIILNARCPRKYGAGAWRHRQLQGYTSVGAGSTIVAVRLNCLPEITLHRLHCG